MRTQQFPRTGRGIEAHVYHPYSSVRPAEPLPLSRDEANDLAYCESQIQGRIDQIAKHWREIARLLSRIRDEKLYRVEFRSFKDYVRQRFAQSAHRARQLINAEGVMEDLESSGEPGTSDLQALGLLSDGPPRPAKPRVLPATESQARPLASLPRSERAPVWAAAVAAMGGKQPTAAVVAEVVRKRAIDVPAAIESVPEPAAGYTKRTGRTILADLAAAIHRLEIARKRIDLTDRDSQAGLRTALVEVRAVEAKFQREMEA